LLRAAKYPADTSRSSLPSRLALGFLRHSLVLALLLATGCSDRERANPFDPRNPNTQGRPIDFVALAGNGVVTLRWQPVPGAGVTGYQAFRRAPGDADFLPLGDPQPITAYQLLDFAVVNGSDYRYRLFYLFNGAPGGAPAEAAAMPGTLRPWMTDLSAGRLHRLTPDGRYVLFSETGFDGPTQLAIDPVNGRVWVSDTFADHEVIFDPNTGGRILVPGVSRPEGIAVDPVTHTGWICDPGNKRLLHVTHLGRNSIPDVVPGLLDPVSVALDPTDASVWVCEQLVDRVRRFSADGTELASATVLEPSRVVIDSLTHDAWVTSLVERRVVRIRSTGEIRDTIGGFSGPIGIDVDARRGRAWVADAVANQVVMLSRGGAVLRRFSGLSEAREVAVDRGTGEAWVTLPGSGEVARLSGDTGAVLRRLGGFSQPYAIALDGMQ